MESMKDGGAAADVDHNMSLRGDEKNTAENKRLCSGHPSPSLNFPSQLPLTGAKVFTCPYHL